MASNARRSIKKQDSREEKHCDDRQSAVEGNAEKGGLVENEKPDFVVYATSTPLAKPKTKTSGSETKVQGSTSSVTRNKFNRPRLGKGFTLHQKQSQVGECSKETELSNESERSPHSRDGKSPHNPDGKVEANDEYSSTGNSESAVADVMIDGAQAVHSSLRKRRSARCCSCHACHLKGNVSKTVQTEVNTTDSSPGSASDDNSDLHARFSSARESLSELMRKCSSDGRNLSRSRPANSYREMMRQHHEMGSHDDHFLWPDDVLDLNTDIPAPPQALLNGDDIDDILEFLHLHDTDADREHEEQILPYPVGEPRYTTCQICLDVKMLHLRFCCEYPACDSCLSQYCSVQVQLAVVKIPCIGLDCQEFMHRDEVSARLAGSMKEKFYKFLVDANKDPNTKTCPQCSHVTTYEPQILKNPKVKKKGLKVICSECHLEWCFPCHAPYHEGQTCKDFRKGDKLLRTWAKEKHYGQANARKCPRCKVYIQRTTGCDHMQCSRCKTSFCYRCGDRYWRLKFVGDHYSRFSILGCKYRFMPHKPFQRKLIRGSIFGGKLVVAPLVAGVALAVGAPLLGVGLVALMVYGGYQAHKAVQKRRFIKRHRARIEMIRQRGNRKAMKDDMEISYPMTNTDNLEEIEASRLEHSKSDSVNLGTPELSDSSSFESETGASQFTQVKVIAEQIKENVSSVGTGSSKRNSEGEVICDCGFCDDSSLVAEDDFPLEENKQIEEEENEEEIVSSDESYHEILYHSTWYGGQGEPGQVYLSPMSPRAVLSGSNRFDPVFVTYL